jgi:CheY-like chemotaxis protein
MPTKPHKVLLFEDDYESMRYLKEYLEEDLGWSVVLSADKDVLGRLSTERFDLVAIDLMIQPTSLDAQGHLVENVHFENVPWQRTGLEFLRRLRGGEFGLTGGTGTSPSVPVLVLSAVAGYSVEGKLGKDMLEEAYVEKPFRLDDLVGCMTRLLKE